MAVCKCISWVNLIAGEFLNFQRNIFSHTILSSAFSYRLFPRSFITDMFLIVPRDTLSCCFPLDSFVQNFKYECKQEDENVPYKLGLCFIYKVYKLKGWSLLQLYFIFQMWFVCILSVSIFILTCQTPIHIILAKIEIMILTVL